MVQGETTSFKKVLLADDHIMVIDALSAYFKRQAPQAEVLIATTIGGARQILINNPDCEIAVLDYVMPGVAGLTTFQEIVQEFPNVKFVVLSGFVEDELVKSLIGVGIQGVLPKTMASFALMSALNLVISGEKYVPWQLQQPSAIGATCNRAIDEMNLTRREREILACVKQGMTNKEIGRSLDLQEVTIKLHIGSLCRKYGVTNRTQLAVKSLGQGSI